MLLDSCPRKYQLTKYEVGMKAEEDMDSRITLAFGTVVGLGIQKVFEGFSRRDTIFEMFLAWELPLCVTSSKHKKSFFLAIAAIDKIIAMRASGFLKEYIFVDAELSFLVSFPDGFNERGFLDLVLEHSETGEILCVEIKTDSSKYAVHEAKYSNSPQALGYSIVLDTVQPGITSYKVLYLVYMSELMDYNVFQFAKSDLAKAEWIQTALVKIEILKLYERNQAFPKHGQNCLAWNRPCRFYGVCNLSDPLLLKPITKAQEEKIAAENNEKYRIQISIENLIEAQLNRIEL